MTPHHLGPPSWATRQGQRRVELARPWDYSSPQSGPGAQKCVSGYHPVARGIQEFERILLGFPLASWLLRRVGLPLPVDEN